MGSNVELRSKALKWMYSSDVDDVVKGLGNGKKKSEDEEQSEAGSEQMSEAKRVGNISEMEEEQERVSAMKKAQRKSNSNTNVPSLKFQKEQKKTSPPQSHRSKETSDFTDSETMDVAQNSLLSMIDRLIPCQEEA